MTTWPAASGSDNATDWAGGSGARAPPIDAYDDLRAARAEAAADRPSPARGHRGGDPDPRRRRRVAAAPLPRHLPAGDRRARLRRPPRDLARLAARERACPG